MCEPTTLMLGLSIAGTAFSAMQQYQAQQYAHQQSQMEQQYANYNYEAQKQATWQDAMRQIQQLSTQSGQIDAEAADKTMERRIEAMKARAKAAVAAGEAGIGGLTPEAIQQSITAEAGRDISTIESNRAAKQAQNIHEKTQAWHRGQTVGLAPYISQAGKPSLAGTLVSAGLSIGGAYAGYKAGQPKTGATNTYKHHRADGKH
jgi:hypothetical protein